MHRAVEQGDRAPVVAGIGIANEGSGEAVAREGERRREPCRPGADDGDVERLGLAGQVANSL